MDSSLAHSPSFHHVLLNSTQRFVCNPDRQMHMSRGILAAGHRLLRIDFILLFQLPSKSQSDNRSSACSATNITMIANNCPPVNETSYSKFANFLTAESLVSPTETAWIKLDDSSGRVLRLEDEEGGEDSEER